MVDDKIEIVHTVEVPGGDPRWPISVQVERRTTVKDGKEKTYINLLLVIGLKKMFIPRRVSAELARALEEASVVATSAYEELLEDSNLIPRRPRRQLP